MKMRYTYIRVKIYLKPNIIELEKGKPTVMWGRKIVHPLIIEIGRAGRLPIL
jgi:hypothetical protein